MNILLHWLTKRYRMNRKSNLISDYDYYYNLDNVSDSLLSTMYNRNDFIRSDMTIRSDRNETRGKCWKVLLQFRARTPKRRKNRYNYTDLSSGNICTLGRERHWPFRKWNFQYKFRVKPRNEGARGLSVRIDTDFILRHWVARKLC